MAGETRISDNGYYSVLAVGRGRRIVRLRQRFSYIKRLLHLIAAVPSRHYACWAQLKCFTSRCPDTRLDTRAAFSCLWQA